MESAIRLAEASDSAPVTETAISLRAPSPSRTTCRARFLSRASRPKRKSSRSGSEASVTRGAPCARPVAKSRSVSLVEVSLSTVTALKLPSTLAESSAWRALAEIGASVATKESMVAMSGAIMPAPLAMPLIVTSASPSLTRTVASFG